MALRNVRRCTTPPLADRIVEEGRGGAASGSTLHQRGRGGTTSSNPSGAYLGSLLAMPRQSHPAGAAKLMHPTEISRPIHHAGWVYEEKVDGWRMVATKAEGSVRLVSRNGLDHTRRFPELVTALAALKPATFTLDGEVAVYDAELVSHFEWLRHLNHGALSTPPMFMVFDLLQLGEHDYRPEPLRVRRTALEKLLKVRASSSRHGDSPATDSQRGRKCCTVAGRATWRRIPSRPISAGAR